MRLNQKKNTRLKYLYENYERFNKLMYFCQNSIK